jgi:hypothetical protein
MGASSYIVLYGNSVILAGIGTELQRRYPFDLITLDPESPDAVDRICALAPRAVLFDLAAAPPDSIIALLSEQPGLLLAGVDPSSDHVLVVSCHRERAVAPADLLDVIDREIEQRAVSARPPQTPVVP